MKILLAGPGTGKTTNIQSIIKENEDLSSILVISFTNATVEDLKKSLVSIGLNEDSCMTLHKFAVKYNHDKTRHVLENIETDQLHQISKQTEIGFDELCNFLSVTTFDQMIGRFVHYAKANPVYLKEKLSRYGTLVVDEYQDFNKNEQELIDLLVEIIPEVYILGDDDQCIYDFKDASNEKIIELHNDSSHEKIGHEHKCYRCPDIVVEKATNLIKNNSKRVDKKWEKGGKIGSLTTKQFLLNSESAKYVSKEISKVQESSPADKILVLSPVSFFIEDLVKQLEADGIEHKNYFVGKVAQELIVKSWALKFLFSDNKYLNLILMGYQILTPRSKLYSLIKKHYATGQNFEELYQASKGKIPLEIKTAYKSIEEALQNPYFQDLSKFYSKAEGKTDAEKLENLFILIDEAAEKNVSIMSIHKSKGLGAEHVFIIGLVEGIIPNRARGNDTIESQRRLFYVGMTRAKKHLHLISSVNLEGKYVNKVNKEDFKFDVGTKTWKGKASRFIEELG
ncbi:MAG: hypothetical protein RL641_446 [Candidatus Parcubacteria bacterium]|jgi:DNA helicase-2/ATP-dependent DNA helicase PcrA